MRAAKSAVSNILDAKLLELRGLFHTEETPVFIVKTFGAVRAAPVCAYV